MEERRKEKKKTSFYWFVRRLGGRCLGDVSLSSMMNPSHRICTCPSLLKGDMIENLFLYRQAIGTCQDILAFLEKYMGTFRFRSTPSVKIQQVSIHTL